MTTDEIAIQFNQKFQEYTDKIPISEMSSLIKEYPHEKWRSIIVKQMQEDGILIPQELLDKIKEYDINQIKEKEHEEILMKFYTNNPNDINDKYSQYRSYCISNGYTFRSKFEFRYFMSKKCETKIMDF